ncbi:MAG: hypothetical protein HZA34_03635 [Candidatus Pacebacteria bacterium]|nr:hypothetical protein [Candidatus Paceibacterota bacterium]
MKNNDLQVLSSSAEPHDNGFLPGLVFGAFAGIAGMFLFGTKKGQKTVEQMKKTWRKMKPEVEEELEKAGHKMEKTNRPVLQALGEIAQYVAEKLDDGRGKKGKK